MKDEELNSLLCEIFDDIKVIKKEYEIILLGIENVSNQVETLDKSFDDVPVEQPAISLEPIKELIGHSHRELLDAVKNQPKDVIHEKRILLYPEGQGKGFLESITRWFIVSLVTLVAIYLLGNIIAQYVIDNSENKKYKIAYQWVYINQAEKNQKYLQNEFLLIQNDSIRAIRLKEVKKYFK